MLSQSILIGGLLLGSVLGQRNCRDQQYVPVPNNGLEVTQNQSVTQTFTVGVAGRLTQVQLVGFQQLRGVTLHPLEIAIVTTANGIPTATTLATLSVPPAAIPTSRATVTLDLTFAGVRLARAQVLGLRLSTLAPGGGPVYGWDADAVTSSYAGGGVFVQGSNPLPWDMGFRTFVAVDAAWSNYGNGHPGRLGVPWLIASATPRPGTTIGIVVGNSAGIATHGSLLLGVQQASLPTPFGGTLLLAPNANLGIDLGIGGVSVPFRVPSDPTLCGAQVFLQSLQVDSGASHQVSFSRGLVLDLG